MARTTNRADSPQRPPQGSARSISPEARRHMIDEAAYYHYVQRGYTGGHELEDWLAAEAEIDSADRRQQAGEADAMVEVFTAYGGGRSPRADDALKRDLKIHSQRDIARIESMDPEDAPKKE